VYSNPQLPSLNLAQAVTVFGYEWWTHFCEHEHHLQTAAERGWGECILFSLYWKSETHEPDMKLAYFIYLFIFFDFHSGTKCFEGTNFLLCCSIG
jgi:hypothetical protein